MDTRACSVALVLAAAVATAGGTAAAADKTSGDKSVVGGDRVNLSVGAPVNVCGNAIAVLGGARAACPASASHASASRSANLRRGSSTGGDEVNARANAPVSACGNSVAALGDAAADCARPAEHHHGKHPRRPEHPSDDNGPKAQQPSHNAPPKADTPQSEHAPHAAAPEPADRPVSGHSHALPFTGDNSSVLFPIGAAALAVGAGLVVFARRFARR